MNFNKLIQIFLLMVKDNYCNYYLKVQGASFILNYRIDYNFD
jgi:hypothetical protein